MNTKLSVCGSDCSICEYLEKSECIGCSKVKGKVWWLNYISADICPIYNCVINEKKFKNCGECSEIPCKLWRDLKDPNYTDEQHEAGIKNRVENLKNLKNN
jgi:hypothetical protein